MAYRKIIAGTDGSSTAGIALITAARVARACGAAMQIVSAYEVKDDTEPMLSEAVLLAKQEGVEADSAAIEGDPADAIIEQAETAGADLIAVGSKGMSSAKRLMLGGVPDRVSHYSPCDLLIVRTTAEFDAMRQAGRYRKIIVATDGSPTATAAARKGVQLAAAVGGVVTLAFVGSPPTGKRIIKQTMNRVGRGVDVESHILEGDAAEKICEAAASEAFDLVVIGNKGMSGARRLLGSVPNNVSHYASCDVLIVQTTSRSADELEKGEGGIVTIDGRRAAAFKDETGKIHAVSPRCTHLGCRVGWNPRDLTWDCPCHGSRYKFTGEVIQGPAERDLEWVWSERFEHHQPEDHKKRSET